ncbi:MAG: hypothetical protein ACKVOE_10980 [Rickettsiales bacterium]
MRLLPTCLALVAMVTLGACDMMKDDNVVKTGSLTQHLTMIDTDGRVYGVVELDPLNGGRIWDSQNRLIGRIVPPAPPQPTPVAPAN